jgi:TolB-like protein/cytochrome c-type biogenesis protein CcmH/NrfG
MLLACPGELITREEIREKLWPGDTYVDFDHGLNNAVNRLRDALGDSANSPRFIETLPRRGYRFIPNVEIVRAEPDSVDIPEQVAVAELTRRRRRYLAAAAVLLVAVSVGIFATSRERSHIGQIKSLAVLPLENVTGDPGQDYFADGMTDMLITSLAELRSVRVISRTSAMHYKGSHKSLPEIAQELDVDAVVEGTVSRSGNRVRINAQLIDAHQDRHLWAAAYDRDLGDLLALQSELAEAISKQVGNRVDPRPTLPSPDRKIVPEAYEAYLRGRYWETHDPFTSDGFQKARQSFNRAIQLDPNYSEAIVGLAETYIPEDLATARLLASKTLELDGNSGEAHAILGIVAYAVDWNFPVADKEFRLSLELDPNSVPARSWYGIFLAQTGHFDDALRVLRQAELLDPLSPTIGSDIGEALYLGHHYNEAIEQELKVLRQYPNYQRGQRHLMRVYEQADRIPEAITAFAKAPGWYDLEPDQVEGLAQRWRSAFSRGGASAYWRERLGFELPRKAGGVGHYFGLARVYAKLGDSGNAIAALEEAYDHHDPMLVAVIKTDPQLDNVRSDPRFQTLLRRIGFPS